jgi:hypothetical protein
MTLPSYLGLWWRLTAPRMLRLVLHELLISTAAPRLHRQRLKVHMRAANGEDNRRKLTGPLEVPPSAAQGVLLKLSREHE